MKKGQTKVIITILIILIVLGIMFVLLSIWQVPYTGKTIYTEQEPYEDEEAYTVEEPYQENVNLNYRVVNTYISNCGNLFDYILCRYVEIENLDTEGGTFGISCKFETLYKTLSDSDSGYVAPGSKKTLECSGNVDLGEDTKSNYYVNPGTKIVTRYKSVIKYRTVTRYREVSKEKDITKYCSALDKIVGNC